MRSAVLAFALLAIATVAAPPAGAHEACGGQPPYGGCSPRYAEALAGRADLMAGLGVVLGHHHEGPRETPWHYHPGPYECAPPWCLPSYHRHRERVVVAHPLPVAVVLQRLRHLDYDGFTAVLLDGANYLIDAHNRYGQPVRLAVSAGTGLLRRQIVLPTY